ncbi:MAG: adenosylcobalamin-dependent ribonucleoside-diphosphate reductase [Bdellovibrionaceae bacterium]|jgi:ribonucleoside-diphosphate reductase alpha chain|nr:adenosylcobalamin-dependent ribonucleoside-diphosphate reductase [Pseudobdellovibrionaceae bacterium]
METETTIIDDKRINTSPEFLAPKVGGNESSISDMGKSELKKVRDNVATLEELAKPNTQFTDDFSKEVFDMTYKYENENDINDRHLAIAKDIASVEKEEVRAYWAKRFLHILEDFKFVPGGRITSNAGTNLKGTTYINCFVSGFRGENQDSMESIMDELRRQALILKSEGGYGFCADVMRPRGAFVQGIGGDSPGAVKLLEMWDTQSAVITAGSGFKKKDNKGKKKIRKGAQMVTMSVFHPDIEEFITAKQTPGRLTKFNMSVLVSDAFMTAVENKEPWNLEFPDFELVKEEYQKYWDGSIKKWKANGYPVKVYKAYNSAVELWDLIMKSTYNRNEPGILFDDTINKLNNLYYAEHINATNPCGEQVLPVGGSCLLGSINLTQFVDTKNQTWDFDKLKDVIVSAVRFMDNVNDRTQVPLVEQKENLIAKRRIGLGVLGYGSALMMMKQRYGSESALKLTEKLCQFIMNQAYRTSSELAKEKGVFEIFDKEAYLGGEFVKNLDEEVREMIKENGIRNSHLLSIQPTGNSSVLSNNVSGGLEPLFMSDYIRTSMQPYPPEGLGVPTDINWEAKSCSVKGPETHWEWGKEGDESVLVTKFNNETWKFDASRGLLKESRVRDYAVRYHEENNSWEPDAEWAATTYGLNIDDHIKTMGVFSKYVDAAMSKTVNIPEDYPYEDFKRLYLEAYKTGTIKGCTSYREGTMLAVLSGENNTELAKGIPRTKAAKRPQTMPCDIHHITSGGEKWIVIVGLLDEDPYEVFALRQSKLHLPTKLKSGSMVKAKSGYNLETEDGWVLTDIQSLFESDEQEALTRLISTSLRHGADIEFIVSQLVKSEGNITSFSKAIARTLKKYVSEVISMKCTECTSKNVKLQEGCFVCLDCGSSKCE